MEPQEQQRRPSTADLADADREDDLATQQDETGETHGDGSPAAAGDTSPLFDTADSRRFQGEWEAIQTGFVDEPRGAVQQADALVADLMQRLAATFAEERSNLEAQWDQGDEVSTEDLRLALRHYRSFFARLLNV